MYHIISYIIYRIVYISTT